MDDQILPKLSPKIRTYARLVWLEISERTQLVITKRAAVILPYREEDPRPIFERWVRLPENDPGPYYQETIALKPPLAPVEGLIAIGYGPRTDTLAVHLKEEAAAAHEE